MPTEGASYIPELVPTSPQGSGPVSEGDDEFRQKKQLLQNQFPDVPAGPIKNAGEAPAVPDDTASGAANILFWTPKAIADFVKQYWSTWGLSSPIGFGMRARMEAGFTVPNNTPTKTRWATPEFDDAGWWDAENMRYVPQQPGKYRLHCMATIDPSSGASAGDIARFEARKNGLIDTRKTTPAFAADQIYTIEIDVTIPCNGTSDYIESWFFHQFGQDENFQDKATDTLLEIFFMGD